MMLKYLMNFGYETILEITMLYSEYRKIPNNIAKITYYEKPPTSLIVKNKDGHIQSIPITKNFYYLIVYYIRDLKNIDIELLYNLKHKK